MAATIYPVSLSLLAGFDDSVERWQSLLCFHGNHKTGHCHGNQMTVDFVGCCHDNQMIVAESKTMIVALFVSLGLDR